MTSLRRLLAWLSPDARAKANLKANAEKALRMKREAQANELANRPQSQTAHEGMRPSEDSKVVDASRGAEGGFTPQLKRSHVPRSGDGA